MGTRGVLRGKQNGNLLLRKVADRLKLNPPDTRARARAPPPHSFSTTLRCLRPTNDSAASGSREGQSGETKSGYTDAVEFF